MALSNESYIVNTKTAGEIIVPIKETVPYLNISLIGYQYFNYQSIMSQNLANIVDDIKALQDGGAAQATFDLDKLVAESNAKIDSKINMFNDAIYKKIELLTDEAVTETKKSITQFKEELHGKNGDGGVIADVATNTSAIGDDSSGIVHQINVIESTVGIGKTGGLIQQFSGVSDIVTQVATDVATHDDKLTDIDVIINADKTGLLPRTTTLETLVGGENSGLVKDTQLNKDMIFGDGTYEGILSILGDKTQGLIHYTQLIRSDFDASVSDLNPRLNYVEERLGSNDDNNASGVIGDVKTLQSQVSNLDTIVGLDLKSGLQLKVQNLENYNIQQIRDTLYIADTGLQDVTNKLRDDVDALESSTSSAASTNSDNNTKLRDLIDTNANKISTNVDNISTLTTTVDTINSDLNDNDGIKDQISNMPTSIVESVLTYTDNDNTQTVFTPSILYDMKVQTDALSVDNIASRFVTYFGSGNDALTADEIGNAAINVWVKDTTDAGYVSKTKKVISDYLDANFTMSNIQANHDAISVLNSDNLTDGSVAHTVKTEIDALEDSLTGPDGLITIINGGDTVDGSTDKKIKDSLDAYELTVNSRFNNVTNKIDSDISDVRQEIADQTTELQVELVRYDTILPFLQKMFKYVNNQGSIEDSEIDTIFTTVISKVDALGSTIHNKDYYLVLNTTTSKFEISIKLDSDLTFEPITPGDTKDYVEIIRTSDGYSYFTDLDNTTLDVFGVPVVESGLYQTAVENRLYKDDNDDTGVEITDLTVDNNDTIVLKFATKDIFGARKIHNIPITL